MKNLSIRTRLILDILVPLLIVYTLSVWIETRTNRSEAIRNVERLLQELTAKHAAQIDGYFLAASQIPRTVADVLSIDQTQNEEDFDAMICRMLTPRPNFVGSCIAFEPDVFRSGVERFAPYVYRLKMGSDQLLSADLAKTYKKDYTIWDWYRIPKETGQGTWSEPYYDEGGGNVLMCTYSAPFFRNNRFAGVATIDIALDEIQEHLSRISPSGATYRLLSPSGTFIAAPEKEIVMKETIFSLAKKYKNDPLAEIGRELNDGKSGIVHYSGNVDEPKVWLAYTPLPTSGCQLMVSIPESQVLAPVYAGLLRSISLFCMTLVILSVLIVVVSYRLTAPIKRLVAFAKELAAGNLDAQVGIVHSGGEIGQLEKTFDQMVVDLKSNIEQRIKEESARKTVEGELRVARRIQASLLPRIFPPFPERSEFDLHAMNEPAAYIAGDFFDFFFIEPDKLAFVIADVSGHGIPAALFMAVSRTAVRNFTIPDQSPSYIVDHINRVLNQDNDDMMFVTLFYGHYNVKSGELVYVNAGHNPPYVLRKDGALETLEATGPLVAAFDEAKFEEETIRLEPGDVLVTFTDGVTEAHSTRENVLYGEKRLENLLHEIHEESVKEICDRIFHDADRFAEHERHDDTTLMVLKRNDVSPKN